MIVNKKLFVILLIISKVIFISEFTSCRPAAEKIDEKGNWIAPRKADKLKNPLPDSRFAEQKGKELYNLYCGACHGETGFGDGAAGQTLERPPSNFHNRMIQKQTNGALFWKMSTGRGSMPSFKLVLSEEERWQLVSYIRKLPTLRKVTKPPVALDSAITIQHFMKIDSLAVRILQNPVTGELWYTTFFGDVFRIKIPNNEHPVAEKLFSTTDHGIEILQGAVFLNNSLFLAGNVYVGNKRSTKGRMVRYDLKSGKPEMSVVFNTVEYGANKTIYDHGWNALVISPDKKYIYVNSGARTDHGEVQDNGGAYPHARDNALTAKIFRFPVDAKDLLLPDDEAKLKADGYLFAEGIRNAYDMAFDPNGNLFAISNSADYDYPEDMFWIRQNHHYGFPWIMGGFENPQQYKGWQPDPDKDPFINRTSHSWSTNYYYDDSDFPARPAGIRFSPGVQNLGPDANEYRGHSGKIQDGDQTGIAVSTFTPHCCPIGLFFDTKKILSKDYKGDGFVIRFSLGSTSSLMKPFTNQGSDLLHLRLIYDKVTDNYVVKTNRIVEGFDWPVDAVLIGNDVYVIEYGGKEGNIWKITLPAERKGKGKGKG